MENSFLFISNVESFEESVKGAVCEVTFMSLDKVGENGRLYRFQDSNIILKTLKEAPIRLGLKSFFGGHKKSVQVGTVTEAFMEGKMVRGKILVTAKNIIAKLKKGYKFLLSVGGIGIGHLTQMGKKIYVAVHSPHISHVQIFSPEEGSAGFPEAKVERVISFGESLLYYSNKSLATLVAVGII